MDENKIVNELLTNGHDKEDIMHSIKDVNNRLSWQKKSLCSIYSRNRKKWYNGEITKISTNDKTNEEWLCIKYNHSWNKKIQRFSKYIQPMNVQKHDHHNDIIIKFIINNLKQKQIANQFVNDNIQVTQVAEDEVKYDYVRSEKQNAMTVDDYVLFGELSLRLIHVANTDNAEHNKKKNEIVQRAKTELKEAETIIVNRTKSTCDESQKALKEKLAVIRVYLGELLIEESNYEAACNMFQSALESTGKSLETTETTEFVYDDEKTPHDTDTGHSHTADKATALLVACTCLAMQSCDDNQVKELRKLMQDYYDEDDELRKLMQDYYDEDVNVYANNDEDDDEDVNVYANNDEDDDEDVNVYANNEMNTNMNGIFGKFKGGDFLGGILRGGTMNTNLNGIYPAANMNIKIKNPFKIKKPIDKLLSKLKKKKKKKKINWLRKILSVVNKFVKAPKYPGFCRENTIKQSEIEEKGQTGDVILWSGEDDGSKFIRTFTCSAFSHSGILFRGTIKNKTNGKTTIYGKENTIGIFQASGSNSQMIEDGKVVETGKFKIHLSTLGKMMRTNATYFKLNIGDDADGTKRKDMEEKIKKFAETVIGNKYNHTKLLDINFIDIMRQEVGVKKGYKDRYICSGVVAALFQEAGVLRKKPLCMTYMPGSFCEEEYKKIEKPSLPQKFNPFQKPVFSQNRTDYGKSCNITLEPKGRMIEYSQASTDDHAPIS